MANATLRDLTADTDIGSTDMMPKQAVSGGLKKITGANVKVSLESGGGIALSLAAAMVPAAGADTRLQYNNGMARGGDAELVWNDVDQILRLGASTATAVLQLPSSKTPGSPAVGFGTDFDTGLYEIRDDILAVSVAGERVVSFFDNLLDVGEDEGPQLRSIAGATKPVMHPSQTDDDTGVFRPEINTVTLSAGGVGLLRAAENVTRDFAAIRANPLAVTTETNVSKSVPTSFMTMVIDETNDELEFWVKYADGVSVKSGAVNLS